MVFFDKILTLVGSISTFAAKNPLVSKMLIFSIFTGFITFVITFIKGLVTPHIVNNSLLSLASYFGILDGIGIYITILLAGFGAKQVLAFIRS